MKKSLTIAGVAIIITIALVLALVAACAAPAKPTTMTTTPTPTTTTTAPTTTKTTSAAPQVFNWKVTGYHSRGTVYFGFMEDFAKDVEKASGGRLTMTLYAAGEVMPTADFLDGIKAGAIQASLTYGGLFAGKCPVSYWTLPPPFTLTTYSQFWAFYQSQGIEELLRQGYAATYGVTFVGAAIYESGNYILTGFPVTKASDFQGKKMRSYGAIGEIFALAGGSSIWLPGEEVYGALEKGTIDGVASASLTYQRDMGWHEVSKYVLATPWAPSTSQDLHVNTDVWNSLPDDLKEIIYGALARQSLRHIAFYAENDMKTLAEMQSKWGLKATTLPPEEVAKLTVYSLQWVDKTAGQNPLYAEAAKRLKAYMAAAGL